MNRILKAIIWSFGILVLYIVVINIIASGINISNFFDNSSNNNVNGNIVQIKTGESVNVFITRHRFYGTIEETSASDKTLYLFNFLKMPLVSGKINFVYTHIIILFLVVFIFMFNLMLYIIERRKLTQ